MTGGDAIDGKADVGVANPATGHPHNDLVIQWL